MSRVAIIGGGPAGMMCASEAAHNGHSVTLYERNEKLGKKLFITGKGRCNLTNSADIKDFLKTYRAIRASFTARFTALQTMNLLPQ